MFLFLTGIIAAATWLIGGFSQPAAPPPTTTGGVGDTVTFTDIDGHEGTVTLLSIRRTTDRAPDAATARPRNGSYLIAELRVTATNGTVDASASRFTVTTGGRTYQKNPEPLASHIGGAAQPGHSVEGPVGFDAPIGHLRILFSDRASALASFDVEG